MSPGIPQTVNYNTTTSFTVTPNTGYHITGWTGVTGCGTTATCDVFMTSNRTVAVTYAINTYTLTVVPGANGSVSAGSGAISNCTITGGTCSGTYNHASNINLTATPGTNYYVSGWTINGVSSCGTATTCTVSNLTADTTVTVAFALTTYSLNLAASPALSGTVSASGSWGSLNCPGTCSAGAIDAGTVVALNAAITTGSGANRIQWQGNCSAGGTVSATTSTYNLTMTANMNCTINFLP